MEICLNPKTLKCAQLLIPKISKSVWNVLWLEWMCQARVSQERGIYLPGILETYFTAIVVSNIVTAAPHVMMTSQTCWRLLELLRNTKACLVLFCSICTLFIDLKTLLILSIYVYSSWCLICLICLANGIIMDCLTKRHSQT